MPFILMRPYTKLWQPGPYSFFENIT